MMNIDWAKKSGFWAIHIFIWLLLNIILGSLPFIVTFIRDSNDDPFLVGLLCFCFTVASSGLHIFLLNSQKGELSGLAKVMYMLTIAFSIVWIIIVWTIVQNLPSILQLIDNQLIFKGSIGLYCASVAIFFMSNFKSLSEIVNNHVSKYLIADTITNSKMSGSKMKASLDMEGDF